MRRASSSFALVFGFVSALNACGCAGLHGGKHRSAAPVPADVPSEYQKTTHPEYVVEAPDILQINAVPAQVYKVQNSDTLSVAYLDAAGKPVADQYVVESTGSLELKLGDKSIPLKVEGQTIESVRKAIEKEIVAYGIAKPQVQVGVAQTRATQQVAGEHLVRADGTVYLGVYGAVRVTGLTLEAARQEILAQLQRNKVENIDVTLDVLAYNSKVFYVIFDGAGAGQQVYRLPITGNETVLDAISQVNGLGPVSDQNKIWVARPAPPSVGCDQVLPVDWCGITTKGQTATNYQLLPGDRLYVKAYRATRLDYSMARVFAPVERVLGIVLLGSSTVRSINNSNNNGNNFNNNFNP